MCSAAPYHVLHKLTHSALLQGMQNLSQVLLDLSLHLFSQLGLV